MYCTRGLPVELQTPNTGWQVMNIVPMQAPASSFVLTKPACMTASIQTTVQGIPSQLRICIKGRGTVKTWLRRL